MNTTDESNPNPASYTLDIKTFLRHRDVLIEYSKLMKYQPQPSGNAWCYDGPLALRQFGPDANDAADVLETYPWCDQGLVLWV